MIPTKTLTRKDALLTYFANKHVCEDPSSVDDCSDAVKHYSLSLLEDLYAKEIIADAEVLYHLTKMYDTETLMHDLLDHPGDVSLLIDGSFDFGYDLDTGRFKCNVRYQDESKNSLYREDTIMTPVILPEENLKILPNLIVIPEGKSNQIDISCCDKYASLTIRFINAYRLWSDNFRRIFDNWISRKIVYEVEQGTWVGEPPCIM